MEIQQRIINWGHGYLDPQYLVMHETANPGATALNHVNYWANNPDVPMTHYVTDWNGIVYHTVPDDRICWHVGNGNYCTVGIELCHAMKRTDFDRVWETAVEFAAQFLLDRGWGIDRLISHNDCIRMFGGTDHTDPLSYFQKFGKSWVQFKQEVYDRMEGEEMPSAKEVADEVWGHMINGHSAGERLYLDNVQLFDRTDYSGRGKDGSTPIERITWMAAKQEAMQESIDSLTKKVNAMEKNIDQILNYVKK